MLTIPEDGWTDFSIGDAKYHLSYLGAGPTDWLKEAIRGLKNFQPFIFYGWCEPEYIFCTVMKNFYYIICVDEGEILKTHAIKMNMLDFCKELYTDISRDIVAWTYFECSENEVENYRLEYMYSERIIKSSLHELGKLIKDSEKYFK